MLDNTNANTLPADRRNELCLAIFSFFEYRSEPSFHKVRSYCPHTLTIATPKKKENGNAIKSVKSNRKACAPFKGHESIYTTATLNNTLCPKKPTSNKTTIYHCN